MDQVNQKVGEGYKAWEEPVTDLPSGLWGLRSGVAAGRQGVDKLGTFLPLLLKARHVDRKDLGDKDLLRSVAQEAGLDVERFMGDLEDPSTLEEVAASHTEAVETHGVFGTPTFVFEGGASAFLKLVRPSDPEDAARAFDSLMTLMKDAAFVGEVKRPQPPWPKGLFPAR